MDVSNSRAVSEVAPVSNGGNIEVISQQLTRNEENTRIDIMIENKCMNCKRIFKTYKGLLIHLHTCNKKVRYDLQTNELDTVNSTTGKEFRNNVDDVSRMEFNFKWNQVEGEKLFSDLTTVYDKIVYWKQNLFLLPYGHAGKQFIKELTRIINAWTNDSPLCIIAMKAIHVMPALFLQKASKKWNLKNTCLHLKGDRNYGMKVIFWYC